MDDQGNSPPSQSKEITQVNRKKVRRATRLRDLTRRRNAKQRIPIEFDQSTGNPLGPNKQRFRSYVALLGRSKASILKKNWDEVELCVKEKIWKSIMLTYDIPNTDFLKKKWVSFAGERWRAFKTQLTSRYVFGPLKDVNPCELYEFLDEETWQKFVESRHDPAFQEKRKKAQQVAAKNCTPHRLSRGGYELLEEKMRQEKLKLHQDASQSDPSAIVSPPSPPERHEKWKRARLNKSGDYTTEEARVVAEKIDSLVDKASKGTFAPFGREDILATAIGRPEHPGRVRGFGRGVGIKQYFGLLSHHGHKSGVITKEQLEAIREEIKQELRQDIKKELASLGLPQRNTNHQPSRSSADDVSSEGSCASDDESEEDRDGGLCKLYVENPLRLVAFGSVHNLSPTIHHKQIEHDKVKVVVERVQDANAPVPVPTEEVQTVGQAPNHFILWPRRLVQHASDKETTKFNKDVPPKPSEPQNDPLTRLCVVAMNIGRQPVQLQLDADVIGKATPIPFYITQKDILELAMGNELLCISVLQLWLMYLHRLCTSKGTADIYGFIDPVHIQSTGNKPDAIQAYIQSRILESNKECYLAPYYHAGHWQLMIICPRQNVVVFLCSLWNKPSKEFKDLVDLVMDACSVLDGSHSTTREKSTWIYPHSRRQTEGTECGYYVMRHMVNIIWANVDSWVEMFENPEPFSQEEIDDVRRSWANYFMEVANL